MTTLLVCGPPRYINRQLICDHLIDALFEVDPVKVVTPDTPFDNVIAELLQYDQSIEYERFYEQRDKYGKSALSRRNYEMCGCASHALIFNDDGEFIRDIMYYINRHNVTIKIINL